HGQVHGRSASAADAHVRRQPEKTTARDGGVRFALVPMALSLIVCGVGGRMGGAVVRAAAQTAGVRLVAAIPKPRSSSLAKDAGEISGAGHLGVEVTDKIQLQLKPDRVIIDFTNPEASLGYLTVAAQKAVPLLIATTGFNSKQLAEIKRLSRRTPTILSANT